MRFAVIDANGVVDNAIDLDPGELIARTVTDPDTNEETTIPAFAIPGCMLIAHEQASPGWTYDGAAFHAPVIPPAPAPKYRLSKRVLVERLNKAGLFAAAIAALGGPGDLLYERWSASVEVDPENADVLALLNSLPGADVQNLLRPGAEI